MLRAPYTGARLVGAAVAARGLHLLRANAVVRGLHVHAARRTARRAQQRHVPQQARQRVVRSAVALPPRARAPAQPQPRACWGAAGSPGRRGGMCCCAARSETRPASSGRPRAGAQQEEGTGRETAKPRGSAQQTHPLPRLRRIFETRQPGRAMLAARARTRAAGARLHAHVQRAAHGARLRLAQVKPEVLRLARLQVLDGHLRGAPRAWFCLSLGFRVFLLQCQVRVATELASKG